MIPLGNLPDATMLSGEPFAETYSGRCVEFPSDGGHDLPGELAEAMSSKPWLEDAMARPGKLEAFTTDQSSQFPGSALTGVLANNDIAIRMDGKSEWRDNVFVERLRRSALNTTRLTCGPTTPSVRHSAAISTSKNARRQHSRRDSATPDQACFTPLPFHLGSLSPAEVPFIIAGNLFGLAVLSRLAPGAVAGASFVEQQSRQEIACAHDGNASEDINPEASVGHLTNRNSTARKHDGIRQCGNRQHESAGGRKGEGHR